MELLIATKPNQVKVVIDQAKEESGNVKYIGSIFNSNTKVAQFYSETAITIDPYKEELPEDTSGFVSDISKYEDNIFKHIKRTVLWFLTFVRKKAAFDEESLTKEFSSNIPLLKIFLKENSYEVDNGKYVINFIPLSFTASLVRTSDNKEIFRIPKFGTFKYFRDRDGVLSFQFAKGRPSAGKKLSISSLIYLYDQGPIFSGIYWRKMKDFQLIGDDIPVPLHFGPLESLNISDVNTLRSVLKHRCGFFFFVPIKDTYPKTAAVSADVEKVKTFLRFIKVNDGKIVENSYGFYVLKAGTKCTVETTLDNKTYSLPISGDRKVYVVDSLTEWTLSKLREGGYL